MSLKRITQFSVTDRQGGFARAMQGAPHGNFALCADLSGKLCE